MAEQTNPLEPIPVFEKSYHGFEDVYDLGRDISEMFQYGPAAGKIPGEFQGRLEVTVTYYPDADDPAV